MEAWLVATVGIELLRITQCRTNGVATDASTSAATNSGAAVGFLILVSEFVLLLL